MADITPEFRQAVETEMAAAHKKIRVWEESILDLGTPFQHCSKLKSFAGPNLSKALDDDLVRIDMPSEYHAPRFVWKVN